MRLRANDASVVVIVVVVVVVIVVVGVVVVVVSAREMVGCAVERRNGRTI